MSSCGEVTLEEKSPPKSVRFAADIDGIVTSAGRSRTGAGKARGNGGGGSNSSNGGGGELGGMSA